MSFEDFFKTLYNIFVTSPLWVQVFLAISFGLCLFAVLAMFVCSLYTAPIANPQQFPQRVLLLIGMIVISALITIFKVFHISTEGLERGLKGYKEKLKELDR